jgi:O-acetyl-ADP-ribose deacetylase
MHASITILKGDITKLETDAIVNAANSSLMGGGGVDGAIHRAGGPQILKECMEIRNRQGECKTGEAVITSAGNMKARFVIHTVGPVWKGGKNRETELLANAYRNSLQLAVAHQCKSIAFPNISTGVYGFPKQLAAEIALQTVYGFIKEDEILNEVIFVCHDEENLQLYRNYQGKLT